MKKVLISVALALSFAPLAVAGNDTLNCINRHADGASNEQRTCPAEARLAKLWVHQLGEQLILTSEYAERPGPTRLFSSAARSTATGYVTDALHTGIRELVRFVDENGEETYVAIDAFPALCPNGEFHEVHFALICRRGE